MRLCLFIALLMVAAPSFAQMPYSDDYSQEAIEWRGMQADMQAEQQHQHDQIFQMQLDMQHQQHEMEREKLQQEELKDAAQSEQWKQEYEERNGSR